MPNPWNVIFSKQSGWPKASGAVKESVPTVRLHTNSCHNLSFTPWVEPTSACEAPVIQHENPGKALPGAEAVSQEADPPEANLDPPAINEKRSTNCAGMDATMNVAQSLPLPQEIVGCREAEERKANRRGRRRTKLSRTDKSLNASARGLLAFKKWWYLRKVGVSVKGELLHGIPIFIRRNTLRIVGNTHSYIIPMDKVDYIRTCDGLHSIESEFEGYVMGESPAL